MRPLGFCTSHLWDSIFMSKAAKRKPHCILNKRIDGQPETQTREIRENIHVQR